MISICIPVYNFNITQLIAALDIQIDEVNQATKGIEIIVIDDGSKDEFKKANQKCLSKHYYLELHNNIGRSKIRNLFKKYVQNKYLLFLDCDSMVVNPLFLQNYLNALKPNIVIYGGRTYSSFIEDKNSILSWNYGKDVEEKNIFQRKREPYLSFMTHNFLIDINVFNSIFFDQNIENYGHEDTLFGYELFRNKIEIIHIDNSVLNLDMASNDFFLIKLESAIRNLVKLQKELNQEDFSNYVRLLKFYKKINLFQRIFIEGFFFMFERMIRQRLRKGNYSKRMIAFYKIGYFLKVQKDN